MRWSVRYQLLLPLVLLLVGVVGMSTWTAAASANRVRRQIETQMRGIATTVGEVTFPRKTQILRLMKGLSGAEYLVCDAHGGPLEDEGQPATTLPALPDHLPLPVSRDQQLRLDEQVEVGGKSYFCNGFPLGPDSQPAWFLYIFYPVSLWREALWEAVRPSLTLGIVGALASILLAVLVARRLGRRIGEIERRTRLIAAGDFGPMPLPRRNDELRDLARSINEMAQRLAQFQETVKSTERLRLLGQVSGGLAHQLRNGVTGAKLAVQLHARECNGHPDSEDLTVALRQLTLVEMHLKRFLDLGRTSEGRREPCALQAVVEQAVMLVQPRCRHAHIDLRWRPGDLPCGMTVLGDANQLVQVMLNLLTNAIEAAGPGGWVQIDLRQDGAAIVEIADSGPGPSPEVANRLFEPFVTGKPEGVGLGLAVARQVVQDHGGAIEWRREADRTVFQVRLPRATASGVA
jgi:signal transduction histidine kinase